MKDKIKQISIWGWAAVILVSISLFILLNAGLAYFDSGLVNPWRMGNNVATIQALEIFSEGVPGDDIHSEARRTALLNTLIFYILGPGLMILFGLREEPQTENGDNRWSLSTIGFLAGLMITVSSLIGFTLQNVEMYSIHEESRISASNSAELDEIRQNLLILAAESYEYWAMPEELGGGGRSFSGLAIDDLPAYRNLDGTYTFAGIPSDTLLRITSSVQPDAANDTSRVTLTVRVQPPDDIIHWEDGR